MKDFDMEPEVNEKIIKNEGAKMKNNCRRDPVS